MNEKLNFTQIIDYLKRHAPIDSEEAINGKKYCFYSQNDALIYIGQLHTNRSRTVSVFNIATGSKVVNLHDGYTYTANSPQELSIYDFKVYELTEDFTNLL